MMNVAPPAVRARAFDAWAPEYDRYRPGYPAALFDLIADRLDLPPDADAVDLGAGTGKVARSIAARGWRTTAVDPGAPMLAVLRERASGEKLTIDVVHATAENTGLPSAAFDVALAGERRGGCMTTETPARTQRPDRFDPSGFEQKWRDRWEADELYVARDDDPRPKRYVLTMYPYPSGDLHIGHWYAMTGPDIVARMHRMRGYNVMFPMGFDGFGLPAENAAIDRGIHPATWTYANIDTMRRQMRLMGASFDWSARGRHLRPDYYRWKQWLFLQLYEAGLAYKAMGAVDWCPKDKIVLAREQVVGTERRCWRCGTPGRQARPGAVVVPDHELRRRAAELRRHRLARADQG